MAKVTKIRPSLANATVSYLVDEVGQLRLRANSIKDDLAYYEEGLKARIGEQEEYAKTLGQQAPPVFTGERFVMTRTKSERTALSKAAVDQFIELLPSRMAALLEAQSKNGYEPAYIVRIKEALDELLDTYSLYATSEVTTMRFVAKGE